MSDKDQSEILISRMHAAQRLLDDEVMELAFIAASARFYDDWKETDDERKQLIAWAKTHALDEVKNQLRVIISQGEYAAEAVRRADEK